MRHDYPVRVKLQLLHMLNNLIWLKKNKKEHLTPHNLKYFRLQAEVV